MIGKVVSDRMEKTVVVAVESLIPHPFYKKKIKRTKKYKVHDVLGVKRGDVVRIAASKPISKDKHFKVIEVVRNGSAS